MIKTIKGEIVTEYLEHPEWGELPSLTLARLIYKDNKEVFKDVEEVRGSVRYYRDKKGQGKDNAQRIRLKRLNWQKRWEFLTLSDYQIRTKMNGMLTYYLKQLHVYCFFRIFTSPIITSKR